MAFMPALAKFIDFQDPDECARVRAITREQITEHDNPDFNIRVVDSTEIFYSEFALDIVGRIVQAAQEGRSCVLILPVGPVPISPTRLPMKSTGSWGQRAVWCHSPWN